MRSAAGIFSPGGVDQGTAVLLREAPAPPADGHLLDLGCGWGPIALTLALRSPDATVYAVDVNERALDLLRHNARARWGSTGCTRASPDGIPDDVRFDAIWSNPPIRVGKAALHELLLHLAAPAGAGRRGLPRGAEEPRLGLAAALARPSSSTREAYAVVPVHLGQGLPDPRGAARLS